MTMQDGSARELVTQLIAHEAARNNSSAPDARSVVSAFKRVSLQLRQWVGADGCRALLVRALDRAQASHPSLSGIKIRSEVPPTLEGVAASVKSHGDVAISEGLQALLVTLFELMARLVGEDLAARLAEQSMAGSVATDEGADDRERENE